jgi:hypothetical protein
MGVVALSPITLILSNPGSNYTEGAVSVVIPIANSDGTPPTVQYDEAQSLGQFFTPGTITGPDANGAYLWGATALTAGGPSVVTFLADGQPGATLPITVAQGTPETLAISDANVTVTAPQPPADPNAQAQVAKAPATPVAPAAAAPAAAPASPAA